MEKFLKKMKDDIDNKIVSCINGKTIVKPFNKVYDEVRQRVKKNKSYSDSSIVGFNKKTLVYSEAEESIYKSVIEKFLRDNPELMELKEE